MNLEQKKESAKFLKRGDIKELARISGISTVAVAKFIKGDFVNSSCEAYFLELVNKRKSEAKEAVSNI